MRILIAEDDCASRAMLVDVLEEAGHQVLATANGAEAWQALQEPDAPRLAILDWVMPKMDGPEVVRRVRAAQTTSLPYIIILSSKSDKADIVAGLAAGANDYVAKPFDIDELCARLEVGRRMVEMQEALRESEEIHRALVESLPDIVMRFDRSGRHLFVSENVSDTVDLRAAQFIGKTHAELGFPDALCHFWEKTIRTVFDSGKPFETEFEVVGKKGPMIHNWRLVPERDAQGSVHSVLSLSRDITAHRRAEQNYQTLFREMLDGFALHEIVCDTAGNPIDYRFLAANPAFENMTGLKAADIVGRTVLEVLPGTEKSWIEIYGRVALTGEPAHFENYHAGLDRHFQVTAFRPAPNQFAGIFVDVTRHKKAEEALRASQQITDLSLRAAHMGAWQWDIAVNRRRFDDQTCRLLGLDPSTFRGEGSEFFAVVHPDDHENLEAALARTLAEDVPYFSEYRAVWPDGSIHFISARGRLSRDEAGRPHRICGILWDVTGSRRDEEEKATLQEQLAQAQKMESVGRLAGGVAHDFNNMLTVILGHTEMAFVETDPALPLHSELEQIRKAAYRSADLTQQLLAFARKQTVAPKVLDLNETVAGMLQMLRRLLGEDIDLAWEPGDNVWPVRIDPSQIDQILANLCVNARDAISGVGRITIETCNATFDEDYCSSHLGYIPGEYVRLVVSDDGCGMDGETLEHVFEPFFTTKGVGEGTGLGLATVYGAVKQNNGFINAYSELGHGTSFTIYLPRHAGKAGRVQTEGASGTAVRGHETVLLVEDEAAILNMTRTILRRQGYTVLAAGTPGEAIRLASEHPGEIHLLITDVIMPEMNGRDLARTIQALYPHAKRLFMSGYTADVIAHHGVLDPGVHFIQKPFSVRGLSAKVREALEHHDGG